MKQNSAALRSMPVHGFDVGDKVYAVYNSAWGMRPMKIERINGDYASCKHPEFAALGGFAFVELRPVTLRRTQALSRLRLAQREVERMSNALFEE